MSTAAYVGIPLALVSTTAYSVGLILEKRALGRMPAINLRKVVRLVVSLLANRAWMAGFALMLTGLALQVIILTIEPVSVAQPVLASGIALTVVLSRLILRERLDGGEFWCVAAMAVGVVLLALSAGGSSTKAGHHADARSMAAVMIPSFLLGLLIGASSLRAGGRKHRTPASGVCYGLGTGLLYGVSGLAIKGLSAILISHRTLTSLAIAIVSSPYVYVLFGSAAVAMLLYQVALQSCRASILIPVSSVTGSVYVVVAGTWLFHERLPASPGELSLRLGGIAMAGLVLIALSRQQASPPVPARVPTTAVPSYLVDLRGR
jgi:drug/metabolite transporter (DMT)-like permease